MLLEDPEYQRNANSVLTQRSVLLETNDNETQVCTKFHQASSVYSGRLSYSSFHTSKRTIFPTVWKETIGRWSVTASQTIIMPLQLYFPHNPFTIVHNCLITVM